MYKMLQISKLNDNASICRTCKQIKPINEKINKIDHFSMPCSGF